MGINILYAALFNNLAPAGLPPNRVEDRPVASIFHGPSLAAASFRLQHDASAGEKALFPGNRKSTPLEGLSLT
ncbi:hypothetical protein [Candidatus Odyssella acanthamoebae]|uniref:Uncharacterized protein n=1 Tax=Candidatus Odyssella acanthamoebae TaxID=91604 RepID=A0A077AV74_9PROT|nr:hypothetical protein [Candidatus Paracaedibacter acanthamoebae]AIK95543.1 hypothetical protein ID47_00345 [Candidatus Paracaedibacter acanthamoebae]